MLNRKRRSRTLVIEALEQRELLDASAELVVDLDAVPVSMSNSPISVVTEADNATYATVGQVDDSGYRSSSLWRIDGDVPRQIAEHVYSVGDFVEDQLYFISRQELWKTDGTEEGTTRVVGMQEGGGFGNLTALDERLFYTERDELWVTDGTESGTTMVADVDPVRGLCLVPGTRCIERARNAPDIRGLREFNGSLFFTVPRGGATELWSSDGTEVGTEIIATMPGTAHAREFKGELIFTVQRGDQSELWISDGTTDGTMAVATIPGEVRVLAASARQVFLKSEHLGLWRTDGTHEGTYQLSIVPVHQTSTVVGERLFYLASLESVGQELWVSDGTVEGTHLVKEIVPGRIGCGIASMIAVDFALYFSAFDAEGNPGLWKSDGTEQGTVLVKSGSLMPYLAVGETLILVGSEPETGRELWKSDGTAEETVLVLDLHAGRRNSIPERAWEAVVHRGMLYFTAYGRRAEGLDLWRIPLDSLQGTSSVAPQAGDANGDGRFDQLDVVTLLQAGKYNTSDAATFEQGDFNGDGLFNQLDIVAALQTANYLQGPYTAETERENHEV